MHIIKCPKCDTDVNDDMNYCHKCGFRLTEPKYKASINYPINNKEYRKASSGLRIIAYLLDLIVITILSIPSIILMIAGIISFLNNDNYTYQCDNLSIFLNNATWFFIGLSLLILPLFYRFIKDGLGKGQSLGKRAVGLMVVDINDNKPCTMVSSALREFIWIALSFIPIVGWLIEPVMGLATEDGRRLGDLAAETMVIEKRDYKEAE